MPKDVENKYGLTDEEEEEALAVHPDFARQQQSILNSLKVPQRGLASKEDTDEDRERYREESLNLIQSATRQNLLKALQSGRPVDEEMLSKYGLYPTSSPRFGSIRDALGKK